MAGQIPQHFIDELLSRIDIVDIINERVTLKKSGSNYMACCPFHNEKTPSFTVSQTKQFYHCFGCRANGSAIGFLMAYENMHFVDAVEMLAERVGMEVPRDERSQRQHQSNKPLYNLLEAVAAFYQAQLRQSQAAIDYLKRRGLSGEIARTFGIGYAPDGWDALTGAFPGREEDLLKTGMLTRGERGGKAYQRFRDRIMFPIRDRRGRVIAFGGRLLGDGEPKYLNSPETPLFHKGSELYGLFEARKAAQDAQQVIVVEGYMDVVALAQHGVDNAVATLGTAANQQHSETLFRVVPNIVFCFDGDNAGRSAAWRALTATLPCLSDGHDAHFLFLPDGEDPDSIVSARGKAGFEDLLSDRLPIIDYLYQHLAENLDLQGIGGRAQLADKAKPLVEKIPAGVYRQLALRRLEQLIGVSLGGRHATAAQQPRVARSSGATAAATDTQEGLTTMSRAVLLVLQHPTVVAAVPGELLDVDPELRGADVLNRLIEDCEAEPAISTARLLERFRDTPFHAYLNKLAIKPYWPDQRELDSATAVADFRACLEALQRKSRRERLKFKDDEELKRYLRARYQKGET